MPPNRSIRKPARRRFDEDARSRGSLLALALSVACAPRLEPPPPRPPPHQTTAEPVVRVLAEVYETERAKGWNATSCERLIARLRRADDAGLVLHELGVVLDRCGRRDEARTTMHAAVARDDRHGHARAWLILDELDRTGDSFLRDAQSQLERVIADEAFQMAFGLVALSRIERRLARASAAESESWRSRAEKNLVRAIVVDESYGPAWVDLVQLHLEPAEPTEGASGNVAAPLPATRLFRASEVARAAVAELPDYPPIHVAAGHVELARGDRAAAIEAYERAIALDPSFTEAQAALGSLQLSLRDGAAAAEAYGAVLALRPRDYGALIGMAVARRLLGDLDGAADQVKAAIQLAPERPQAHFEAAMVAFARNDTTAGRASLERFLTLAKNPALAPTRRRAEQLLRQAP